MTSMCAWHLPSLLGLFIFLVTLLSYEAESRILRRLNSISHRSMKVIIDAISWLKFFYLKTSLYCLREFASLCIYLTSTHKHVYRCVCNLPKLDGLKYIDAYIYLIPNSLQQSQTYCMTNRKCN